MRVDLDGHIVEAGLADGDNEVSVFLAGEVWRFKLPDQLAEADDDVSSEDVVRSPMPGRVIELRTEVGARVEAGTPLLVIEAMKMEHTLQAPRSGIIGELPVSIGDQVDEGMALARLEPAE